MIRVKALDPYFALDKMLWFSNEHIFIKIVNDLKKRKGFILFFRLIAYPYTQYDARHRMLGTLLRIQMKNEIKYC